MRSATASRVATSSRTTSTLSISPKRFMASWAAAMSMNTIPPSNARATPLLSRTVATINGCSRLATSRSTVSPSSTFHSSASVRGTTIELGDTSRSMNCGRDKSSERFPPPRGLSASDVRASSSRVREPSSRVRKGTSDNRSTPKTGMDSCPNSVCSSGATRCRRPSTMAVMAPTSHTHDNSPIRLSSRGRPLAAI